MKNVVVTGISRGLGLKITQVLLQNGYNIYGVCRTVTANLSEMKQKYPEELQIIQFDLENTKGVKQLFCETRLDHEIPLHGFVSNAAVAYDDLITNIDLDSLEKMYRVNVFSPFYFTKYIIRNMLLHKTRGSIVHISSVSVHTGYKGLAMYASCKGAIEAFSKNTAREWGSRGIRSNCIVGGFMETDMNRELTHEQKDRIYKRTALKTATSVLSVSNTVKYLLSGDSESVTGQNIFVDSGTI